MTQAQSKGRQPALFFVAALLLAATAFVLPTSTRAMEGCREGGCTYYFAGGGFTDEAHCGAFDQEWHCFLNADPEMNQHQTSCIAAF